VRDLNPIHGSGMHSWDLPCISTTLGFEIICNPFHDTCPRTASNDHDAGQPTPILHGRLRSAEVGPPVTPKGRGFEIPSAQRPVEVCAGLLQSYGRRLE
jgi:hypothetical protein